MILPARSSLIREAIAEADAKMQRSERETFIDMLDAISGDHPDYTDLLAWYDQTTARLERAERVESGAHEAQALIYRARCLLHDTQRLRNRFDPDKVAEVIEQAERVLWETWNAQNATLTDTPGERANGAGTE